MHHLCSLTFQFCLELQVGLGEEVVVELKVVDVCLGGQHSVVSGHHSRLAPTLQQAL